MAHPLSISTVILDGAFQPAPFRKTAGFTVTGFERELQKFYPQLKKEISLLTERRSVLEKKLQQGPEAISVVFLPANEIKKANQTFRGKGYAPDVLSFLDQDQRVGEILLCPQVIWAQARKGKTLFADEVRLLIIHGFLHLLGYDHEGTRAQARRMYSIQNKLVLRLAKTAPLF